MKTVNLMEYIHHLTDRAHVDMSMLLVNIEIWLVESNRTKMRMLPLLSN